MRKTILIILAFFTSCKNEKVTINKFNFDEPKNWIKLKLENPDIYVTGFSKDGDTIIIQYGISLNEFIDMGNSIESFDTLNNFILQKIIPERSNRGDWGVYVGGQQVENKFRISASINNLDNIVTIKSLISSVKIDGNYKNIQNPKVIGEIIYNRHCFTCHGYLNKGFANISLEKTTKNKSVDFLNNWVKSLTFRRLNKTNSYNNFEGLKNLDCDFSKINDMEQKSLVKFIKNQK